MSHNIKHNIKQPSAWKHGAYILLFSIFYQMAATVLFAIIIFQFVHKLVTGETNSQLRRLSRSIASYIYQLFQFMSFNSNDIPYPFSDWPEDEAELDNKQEADETTVENKAQVKQRDGDADGD